MTTLDAEWRFRLLQLAVSAGSDDPVAMAEQFQAFLFLAGPDASVVVATKRRPSEHLDEIQGLIDQGIQISKIARQFGSAQATIWRLISSGKLHKRKNAAAVANGQRVGKLHPVA